MRKGLKRFLSITLSACMTLPVMSVSTREFDTSFL